jgi:hypothetical protein
MIRDLKKILIQMNEPNEISLVPYDMVHPVYWIWKATNTSLKDLYSFLHKLRPEHARFDIFINGQYILEKDYILEQKGNDVLVSFKRANFGYSLSSSDSIKIEGDIKNNNVN